MISPTPLRSVITGGPGAGKSTVLGALGENGIVVFPEVARAILQAANGMRIRAESSMHFARAMFEAELQAWHRAPAGPSVYDRGFPDIVGFLNLEGLAIPAYLDDACHALRYSGPIFWAPPWREIYTQDDERIQTWDEAVASDAAICAAWRHYGYALLRLPNAPITDRLAHILSHLG